jgi:hypothetical protein
VLATSRVVRVAPSTLGESAGAPLQSELRTLTKDLPGTEHLGAGPADVPRRYGSRAIRGYVYLYPFWPSTGPVATRARDAAGCLALGLLLSLQTGRGKYLYFALQTSGHNWSNMPQKHPTG